MQIMWRHTGNPTRFFCFDAECFLLLMPFLLHMSMATFVISCVAFIFFTIISRRGIPLMVALRIMRTAVIGRIRPSCDTRQFRVRCWYS